MTIEKSEKEIIIRIAADVSIDGLQEIVDYLKYKELLTKSQASDGDIDKLADEVTQAWWDANKQRFEA